MNEHAETSTEYTIDLDEVYDDGYSAYLRNEADGEFSWAKGEQNPYARGTEPYEAWDEGYMDARGYSI